VRDYDIGKMEHTACYYHDNKLEVLRCADNRIVVTKYVGDTITESFIDAVEGKIVCCAVNDHGRAVMYKKGDGMMSCKVWRDKGERIYDSYLFMLEDDEQQSIYSIYDRKLLVLKEGVVIQGYIKIVGDAETKDFLVTEFIVNDDGGHRNFKNVVIMDELHKNVEMRLLTPPKTA
jgi:hypothetical protein